MNEVLLIVGMASVTFAVRYPVLALLSRMTLPPWALSMLRYVPVAVLTAIVVPAILAPDGQTVLVGVGNAHLYAGIAAGVIAWRTRNLLATIGLGMLIFFVWKAAFGA